jgi:hypothetical protein
MVNKPLLYIKGKKYSDQLGDRLFFKMNSLYYSVIVEYRVSFSRSLLRAIFRVVCRENMPNNAPSFGNKFLRLI